MNNLLAAHKNNITYLGSKCNIIYCVYISYIIEHKNPIKIFKYEQQIQKEVRMKKLIVLFILIWFGFLVNHNYGQELYQEGRGNHLDWLYFSLGGGKTSFFQLGGIFRNRLNDHFDAGLIADFFTQRSDKLQPDYLQEPVGESITVGPVFGYTNIFASSGWGIRSSLILRMTLSSLTSTSTSRRMELAGYGADGDISLFKQARLGKLAVIFPSFGIYFHLTRFTGNNQDKYGLSHIYSTEKRRGFEESSGTSLRPGSLFQLPISFQVFGDKRLVLTPAYYLESIYSLGPKAKAVGLFKLGLRFSF
jgi:hypothetical protein